MIGFAPGAAVRVRDNWPELHGPVHIRTPHYLRGVAGRVVRQLGVFPNPEELAFGREAPVIPLYQVAFDPAAIWPDEVFEHWLEPAP